MKNIFKNIKGESVIETVISLTLVTLSIFGAVVLIVSSMQVSSVSQKRILATNLSRECVEAMRSIRDSNWLIYSNKKRECWNHNRTETSDCEDNITPGVTDNPIEPGYYRIDFLPLNPADPIDFNWNIYSDPDAEDWDNDRLYIEEISGLDTEVYTHRDSNADGDDNKQSEYQRRMFIKYLTDANDTDDGTVQDNRMIVDCQVRFRDDARVQVISLATHLTDYYERNGHTD